MDHIITTLTELQSRLTNVIRTKDTNFVWSWETVKTTDDLQLTDIVLAFDIVSQKIFAPQRNGGGSPRPHLNWSAFASA